MKRWLVLAGATLIIGLGIWLITRDSAGNEIEEEPREEAAEAREAASELSGTGAGPAAPVLRAQPPGAEARTGARDLEIFRATMARAYDESLDALPLGERIVALGRWFVGAEYTPGTLEVDPERLVVNLEQFDCVTYVESILAMARLLQPGNAPTFDEYRDELRRIRYRGGEIDGYASRLHYFSDWIADNERKGILRDVTRELGGMPMDEPVNFMSSNRELYLPLESPETLEWILEIERRLSARTAYYIPKSRIPAVEESIRNGDIIAATSSIRGLDVAHTGVAIWIDGALHFMNAPLVGKTVEISPLPLAERIRPIDGQNGIMVARPLEP